MPPKSINQKIIDLLKNGNTAQRKEICRREPMYFAMWYFPEYFKFKIPPFHYDFYQDLKDLISGKIDEAVWKGHRESAKTSIPKIALVVHAICYKTRQYINWDAHDKANSEQALFDVTVALQTNKKIIADFGHLYNKKPTKEAMSEAKLKRISNFITENGIKVEAFSTNQSIRGRLYKSLRPDLIILEDFETSKTRDSYALTNAVKKHIDEMRSGITRCAVLYLCNYITEEGSVAYVCEQVRNNPKGRVREIPLVNSAGQISWPAKYVMTEAEAIETNRHIENPERYVTSVENLRKKLGESTFQTEMMLNPGHSGDKVFDRDIVSELLLAAREPIRTIAGMNIWYEYNPSHRYAIGADTAKGVGKDANAAVIIDFSTNPIRVVATYQNNMMDPVIFAHELKREAEYYGLPLVAPEVNNMGYATVAELKKIYPLDRIYLPIKDEKVKKGLADEYGWDTNNATKPEMIYQLKRAVEDGLIYIPDKDLVNELKYYSLKDLNVYKLEDGMTRHFDKLIALAIAYQMKDHAKLYGPLVKKPYVQKSLPPVVGEYGG